MIIHFIRMISIIGLMLLLMFLPFIPGDYDGLSITLSIMAQIGGFAGLLLVPVGLIWLIWELRKLRRKRDASSRKLSSFPFAVAALVVANVVAISIAFGGLADRRLSFGVAVMVLWIYFIYKLIPKLSKLKASNSPFNFVPVYLVVIPVVVVSVRILFIVPATDRSRSSAIRQSERLISDIEAYNSKNGHYPASLMSLWDDYRPELMGIDRYHYEPNGSAYNIFFEQFSHQIGVREIVMYNKLNQHEMNSHNEDLLKIGPQNTRGGYLSVHELPQTHWKYFWFD